MKTLFFAAAALALAAGTSHAADDSTKQTATLSGAAEVPKADPDGTGTASIEIKPKEGEICWKIAFSKIEPPTAAHIHIAPAGTNGPPVLPLDPIAAGCAKAKPELIKALQQDPSGYYVNVHTADFPPGAIRGQLTKAK